MTDEPRVPLPGSNRGSAPQVQVGEALVAPHTEITLVLRRRAPLPADVVAGDRVLTPQQLADQHGADPADVQRVREVLERAGAQVLEVDVAARRVRAAGTGLAELFGTTLHQATSPAPTGRGEVTHRHRTGELHVPAELADVVVAVLGLDDRPQSRAHFRLATAAVSTSYTPVQLGEVYDFPPGTDGSGQTIAVIELGGGFDPADLRAYFSALGLPTPQVEAVGVDGAANQPGGDPGGADTEVLLDIEVAGALAPGARQVVYFAPNTDAGFLDAVSQAVHATPTPAAVSISWGGPEDTWTAQARDALDHAFQDAAALGVTVTVAAGDDGSSDRESDGRVHVDFPAASPHALACGGTSLPSAGAQETVWNDGAGRGATGGGVSAVFALPAWQAGVGVPARAAGGTGRGVPDVSADADPATGYQVRADGSTTVVGGTSAVAPLWAALVARLAQAAGRPLGLLQPRLYAGVAPGAAAPGFRDVVRGSNGAYQAGPGWDACTGLGTPVGEQLLARLQGTSAAPPQP